MSAASNGGPAFPQKKRVQRAGYATAEYEPESGMSLHDYAAIEFAAAWTVALGSRNMAENYYERGDEAVRLGLAQADAFLKARTS